MKMIFCLHTGDHIIGTLENELDLSQSDQEILIENPMYIVQTLSEAYAVGFKLEDVTLFSEDLTIALKPKDVLLTMKPTQTLCDYYDAVVEFNHLAVRPTIEKQITNSLIDMHDSIVQVKEKLKGKKSRFSKTLTN